MSAPSAGSRMTFDLSGVLPGRIEEAAFKTALEGHDWTRYRGADVRLTGCAPLWSYVYVAVRAAEHAATVSVDDGSENGVRVR